MAKRKERVVTTGAYQPKPITEQPILSREQIESKIKNSQKEFEQDSFISIDTSRITYVCELCGSLNLIEESSCARCGKRRPRTEYINALRQVKASKIAKESPTLVSDIVASQQSNTDNVKNSDKKAVSETLEDAKKSETAPMQIYRFEHNPNVQQAITTIQPLVIVPYVNPNQPLWQYNPDQAFRYVPYTQDELGAMATASGNPLDLQQTRDAKAKELEELDNQLKLMQTNYQEQSPKTQKSRKNRNHIRLSAIISILVIAFMVCGLFLTKLSSNLGTISMPSILTGFVVLMQDVGGTKFGLKSVTSSYSDFIAINNIDSVVGSLLPIGIIFVLIMAFFILISSIIKLFTNRSHSKGFIASIAMLIFVELATVGLILITPKGFGNISGFISSIEPALIAMQAGALLLIITAIFTKRTNK